MAHNDIDMANWKESEVWSDSLWIINERDKSGKHDGFYHGNFVPQIPHQLILKYTKSGDTVLDLFLGSGTTAYEAERLGRNFIGVDIQEKMVNHVRDKMDKSDEVFSEVLVGDSTTQKTAAQIGEVLAKRKQKSCQLTILHPPYANIIKFSDNKNDLSNATSLSEFLVMLRKVVKNARSLTAENGYLAIVIGDVYKNSEWVPLGFYCMHEAQKQGFKLKSIVVKNMAGNRAKQGQESIWRYRSLANDYYVFKHEYIFIFKKI
ncbi:MAG: site-specific DNA-methyltransferase [Candidatus Nomurabacteria bacterium]|jgi:DNA modification methylase|nr:site-specific DNA-methyltransferase [Candidatus Nomurabacteria bacterium]